MRIHINIFVLCLLPTDDNGLTPGETAAIVVPVAFVVVFAIAAIMTCIYFKCKFIKFNRYYIICDWFTKTRKSNLT